MFLGLERVRHRTTALDHVDLCTRWHKHRIHLLAHRSLGVSMHRVVVQNKHTPCTSRRGLSFSPLSWIPRSAKSTALTRRVRFAPGFFELRSEVFDAKYGPRYSVYSSLNVESPSFISSLRDSADWLML